MHNIVYIIFRCVFAKRNDDKFMEAYYIKVYYINELYAV